MKSLCFIVLAITLNVAVGGEVREETIAPLLKSVRNVLPKGWSVSYDKQYHWLKVTTNKAISVVSGGINPMEREPAQLLPFTFAFRVVPFVSFEEHLRQSSDDAKVQQELKVLYDELIKRRVAHMVDSFAPENAEDKKLVSQYGELKKSMHRPPEFYFRDISLEWGANSPDDPMTNAVDPKTSDECTKVREKVANVFKRYRSLVK